MSGRGVKSAPFLRAGGDCVIPNFGAPLHFLKVNPIPRNSLMNSIYFKASRVYFEQCRLFFGAARLRSDKTECNLHLFPGETLWLLLKKICGAARPCAFPCHCLPVVFMLSRNDAAAVCKSRRSF